MVRLKTHYHYKEAFGEDSYQIGKRRPAIPVGVKEHDPADRVVYDVFWGYGEIPPHELKWWLALPLE